VLLSAELGEVFERRCKHPAVQNVVVVVERAEAAVLGAGDAREQDAVFEDAPPTSPRHGVLAVGLRQAPAIR